jgi:hypothetical protein
MANGIKHLIKCRCVLPQFKNSNSPPQHRFIAFSVVNDDDSVVPRFVQCNNCGIIHKIVDVCRSEFTVKEDMTSLKTIEDVKMSIPEKVAIALERHRADLATWEAVQFIIENKKWGDVVVLSTDEAEGLRQGKYMHVLGENLFKIESFAAEYAL